MEGIFMRFSLRTMLLFVGFFAIVLFLGRSLYLSILPVPPAKVAQLKIGMSQNKVRELLGDPYEIEATIWTYGDNHSIGWVHVYFDDNNCLIGTDPEPTEFYYDYP